VKCEKTTIPAKKKGQSRFPGKKKLLLSGEERGKNHESLKKPKEPEGFENSKENCEYM